MIVALVLALAVVFLAAPSASAHERPAELERVASALALRAAEVRCPSAATWVTDPVWAGDETQPRGWAYTSMTRDYIVMHPALCEGARDVTNATVPAWQRAAGVLVLAHEAYHVRRWSGRWNEAKVECRAIRDFRKAAGALGASTQLANELLPWALALHLRMGALFTEYRKPDCRLPIWAPPLSP